MVAAIFSSNMLINPYIDYINSLEHSNPSLFSYSPTG